MTTYQQLCRKPARRSESPRTNRGGSVTLEFLLVLPILLIVLLAAVQFGMYFSNAQQLALASRVGAEAASQTALPASGSTVPAYITEAIQRQLASSAITPCKIIVEHNVTTATPLTWPSASGCPCDPTTTPVPALASYVRVTVFVPMTELAPSCLALFGFDLANRYAQSSTTFRYEL